MSNQTGAPRLGDVLVRLGKATPAQVEEAYKRGLQTKTRLGEVLVQMGVITEQDLAEAISVQLNIPAIDLSGVRPDVELLRFFPEKTAVNLQVLPIRRENGSVVVAMADPTNFHLMKMVKQALSTHSITPMVAAPTQLREAIQHAYGMAVSVQSFRDKQEAIRRETAEKQDDTPEGEIVRIVKTILYRAVRERASDIHIEPLADCVKVRFRIDGVLRDMESLPKNIESALITRIKVMANLKLEEKRVPHDGRFEDTIDGRPLDFRVSTFPVSGVGTGDLDSGTDVTEKVVMRILDRESVLTDIKTLGFTDRNLARYQQITREPYGLVLVVGPTNSGKSTTLYATLQYLEPLKRNIVTLEDPPEYNLYGVFQSKIEPNLEPPNRYDYVDGLRAILRQDPDIVMVGEIRDEEVAEFALKTAQTGKLILSTIHANTSISTITRLRAMGVKPFLLSSALIGVVSQRLVRRNCPDCSQPVEPDPRFVRIYEEIMGVPFSGTTMRGRGCKSCGNIGFRGRLPLHEVLHVGGALKDAIDRNLSEAEMREIAYQSGFEPMVVDALEKVAMGLTTFDEVAGKLHTDQMDYRRSHYPGAALPGSTPATAVSAPAPAHPVAAAAPAPASAPPAGATPTAAAPVRVDTPAPAHAPAPSPASAPVSAPAPAGSLPDGSGAAEARPGGSGAAGNAGRLRPDPGAPASGISLTERMRQLSMPSGEPQAPAAAPAEAPAEVAAPHAPESAPAPEPAGAPRGTDAPGPGSDLKARLDALRQRITLDPPTATPGSEAPAGAPASPGTAGSPAPGGVLPRGSRTIIGAPGGAGHGGAPAGSTPAGVRPNGTSGRRSIAPVSAGSGTDASSAPSLRERVRRFKEESVSGNGGDGR